MMSKTGNKGPVFLGIFSKGFTLLEVMITVAVLALGASLIYQSYFIAVDSFTYYSTLLKITPWMDEKIWQVQNDLRHSGPAAAISASGQVDVNNKSINWNLACSSRDQTDSLYAVDLVLSWPQSGRQVKLSRSAYALYSKK